MSIMQSGVVDVKLSRGLVAIIDVEDFELVSQHKWCAVRSTKTDYAIRGQRVSGKHVSFMMHRVLLNATDGMHVDHINGNGLDNRRANLRLCTQRENNRNSQKQKGCSSEFKGVSKCKQNQGYPKPWLAKLYVDKKTYCRSFATEIEAALWYDEMAKEHHGVFARLNFPQIEGQR